MNFVEFAAVVGWGDGGRAAGNGFSFGTFSKRKRK
jgi:hypothetical protein